MKKIFLKGIILTGAITLPVSLVVSYSGGNKPNVTGDGKYGTKKAMRKNRDEVKSSIDKSKYAYAKGTIFSNFDFPKKISDWGSENFANLKLTNFDSKNKAEQLRRRKTGQPYSLHFHPRDLANWTHENDADADFSKGVIPLKNREFAFKVMNSQQDKNLDILASLSKNTSGTYSGTNSWDYSQNRVFTRWSNINSITNWGGSTSEGLILLPKASDINVAHKNGVRIIATAFFPPSAFGGSEEMYKDMLEMKNGKYVVAENMVKMAKYYGFDGWFFNMEAPSSKITNDKFESFLKFLYSEMKKEKLTLQLYDYGEGKKFYATNNFDQASIDFHNRGTTYGIKDSDKISYGYNYDTGSGPNGEINMSDEGGFWNSNHYSKENSWIYTYFRKHDRITDGDNVDIRFFTDSEGHRDMRYAGTDTSIEMGDFYRQRTTIDGKDNFYTNFQLGAGKKYYVRGKEIKMSKSLNEKGYRNIGLQSILPTWQWIFDKYNYDSSTNSLGNRDGKVGDDIVVGTQGKKETWNAEIKEDGKVWSGSTKLYLSGKIDSGKVITSKLFGTSATLKGNEQFKIVVEGKNNIPSLAIWEDNNTKPTIINNSSVSDLENGFVEASYFVPVSYRNKKLMAFGLAYINESTNSSIKEIKSSVSSIKFIINKSKSITTNKVISLSNKGNFLFGGSLKARIAWKMNDVSKVNHYEIWSNEEGNKFEKKILLGVSDIPAAYLKNLPMNKNISLVIVAYDANGDVVSENNAVLETTFKSMKDMSKWDVQYKYPHSSKAEYVNQPFGNGFVSSLLDNKGNLFIADDYAHVIKVGLDGKLKSKGNDSWGVPIEKPNKDVKVLKLINKSETEFFAITSKGKVQLIDKNTGAVDTKFDSSQLFNIIKTNVSNSFKDSSKAINNLSIIGRNKSNIYLKTTSTIQTNGNDYNKTIFIKFNKDTGNSDILTSIPGGIIIMKFFEKNNKTYSVLRDGSNDVKISETTFGANGFVTNIDVANGINISNNISSFLNGSFSTDVNKINNSMLDSNSKSIISDSEIVFSKILKDGKVLLVNSSGIALKVDIIDPTKTLVSSLISPTEWDNKLKEAEINVVDQAGAPRSSLTKISELIGLPKDGGKIIDGDLLSFNEENDQLTLLPISSWEFKWWGFWGDVRNVKIVSIKDMSNSYLTEIKNVSLPTANDKKIDSLRFIKFIKGVFIIGGSTGKIALLDKDLKSIPFGNKVYKYDGKEITSESFIYDDGTRKIPGYLTK